MITAGEKGKGKRKAPPSVIARSPKAVEAISISSMCDAGIDYFVGRAGHHHQDRSRQPRLEPLGTAPAPYRKDAKSTKEYDRSRRDQVPRAFIPCAPDLAIEILSPEARRTQIAEKVADYLAAGTRLVWIVDPEERQGFVHHPNRPPLVVAGRGSLDGQDVLPGFRCAVAELLDASAPRG